MAQKLERVTVVTAHPDDPEFGAGGTVAKMVKEGCEVTYVVVTNGNKGSSDRSMTPERLARIREEEQRNAARTLGVKRVEFLGYPDGEVEDTRDLRRDVSRMIRAWRPDLVVCQNPHRTYLLGASHRDHRIVGGVTLDCIYPLARDHMAFPELMPTFEPHRVREVYVMQWQDPQVAVDISDTNGLRRRRGAGAQPRATTGAGEGPGVRGGVRPHRHSVMGATARCHSRRGIAPHFVISPVITSHAITKARLGPEILTAPCSQGAVKGPGQKLDSTRSD